MARIVGIDLPREKRVVIGLTYIYGIGKATAEKILKALKGGSSWEEVKTKYTKEEFIECLKENGIVGMGGSGFPTYIKYDVKKIKTLIVNGVECEPYLHSDYVLAYNKCEEILEVIDTILEINNIDEAIIVFRKNNNDLKELFDNYIGTYLKIKIVVVSNDYPNGWERQLISKVMNVEYNNLPIEVTVQQPTHPL